MSMIAQYDARMTLNTTSDKKKKLQELAAEKRITDAEILRMAVDQLLERWSVGPDYRREG